MEELNPLDGFLNKIKGSICCEFEKICPTEKSFIRERKHLHDLFDEIKQYIENNYSEK